MTVLKNRAPTGSGFIYAPYIPLHVTSTQMILFGGIKLPRNRKSFTKWVEGRAFSDLMDTGNKNIQIVLDLHARHGVEYAWLAYAALAYIQHHGVDDAYLEARKLYIEVFVLNTHHQYNKMTPDQESNVIELLTWACKSIPNFEKSAKGQSRLQLRAHGWPIKAGPHDNDEMLQLAHFLIILAHASKPTNTCSDAVFDVYNTHIRPNVL